MTHVDTESTEKSLSGASLADWMQRPRQDWMDDLERRNNGRASQNFDDALFVAQRPFRRTAHFPGFFGLTVEVTKPIDEMRGEITFDQQRAVWMANGVVEVVE